MIFFIILFISFDKKDIKLKLPHKQKIQETVVRKNVTNPEWESEHIFTVLYNPISEEFPSLTFQLWDKNLMKDKKVFFLLIYLLH